MIIVQNNNCSETRYILKPVWAVGFALEQTLRDATLAVFSFANFKTASAYCASTKTNCLNNFFVFLNFSFVLCF
ncbi:MAG: hypothetical protein LBH59_06050 [Planctomycetaceae bacterium]|nr:hypothetical protein [Planctomycetaceae bacterium]